MVVAVPAQVVLPDGSTSYYKEHPLPRFTSRRVPLVQNLEASSILATQKWTIWNQTTRTEKSSRTQLPKELMSQIAVTPTLEIGTKMKTLMPWEIVGVTSRTRLATARRIRAPPPPVKKSDLQDRSDGVGFGPELLHPPA